MEGVIKFGQISKTESERASERRGKANSGRPETEKKENRFNIIDRQAANVRWAAIQLEWRWTLSLSLPSIELEHSTQFTVDPILTLLRSASEELMALNLSGGALACPLSVPELAEAAAAVAAFRLTSHSTSEWVSVWAGCDIENVSIDVDDGLMSGY